MVLAIMVSFLCFRVYQVVQPPQTQETEKNFQPPGNELPLDVETPGVPPRTPGLPDSENWTNLWRSNPFYYPPGGSRSKPTDGEPEIDLKLLNIQQMFDGTYRARIRSASRKGWYSEGDGFEAYELVSIDPDTDCIVVFAEEFESRVEICIDD